MGAAESRRLVGRISRDIACRDARLARLAVRGQFRSIEINLGRPTTGKNAFPRRGPRELPRVSKAKGTATWCTNPRQVAAFVDRASLIQRLKEKTSLVINVRPLPPVLCFFFFLLMTYIHSRCYIVISNPVLLVMTACLSPMFAAVAHVVVVDCWCVLQLRHW